MLTRLKNSLIRRLAKSWLLKRIDGKKKEIGRILLGAQMVILAVVQVWPDSQAGQYLASFLHEALIVAAWLGLEFGIQDEEAKRVQGDHKGFF